MNEKKHLLVINGKALAETGVIPPPTGDSRIEERKYKRNLAQAKEYLLPQINQLRLDVEELPQENILKNIYFRISYPNGFLAKSYQVSSIYRDSGLTLIGSSSWKDDEGKEGKSDYLFGTKDNIEALSLAISDSSVQIQQKEIRRMEEISLLKPLIFDDSESKSYELVFHSVENIEELLSKFQAITGLNSNEYSFIHTVNNVVFIVCKLTNEKLINLRNFNPLRAAYSSENREFSADNFFPEQILNKYTDISLDSESVKQLPWIGLIDGGVSKSNNFFLPVEQIHESTAPASSRFIEHGSSVASVLLYGELDGQNGGGELVPSFRVQSIRALPSEEDMEFNLLTLDKMIMEIVPKYSNIRVWNLSIGPVGPIQDEVVSSLTRILDQIAYENDIIFVIAAGNTGEHTGIAKRIQIPGDAVNNLTVSAYYKHHENKITSPYSSIGLGREGAKLKPDLIDHGGLLPIDPIYTISSSNYFLNKVQGTSFSAPNVARKLALILNEYPDFNVWEARALLEHSLALRISSAKDIQFEGKGEFDKGSVQLIASEEDEIRIMYSGIISAKGYVILPIPIPEETIAKTAEFTWTLVTKTKINPDNTDKYTEYGIEDDFYPNADKYPFRKGDKTIYVDLSSEEGKASAEVLLEEGFKKSSYPKKQPSKYLDETERRNKFLKWDTSKTQRIRKRVHGLKRPFIRLHGLSRSENRDRIEYVLVVTVRFVKDTSIYDNVMSKYPILQSIQVRSEGRQQV
ncbi:S8 family peptidase [Enterococcus faecium]|uniref:S8 family peptidase n=1 Tax=Enterococcus faecium TaxID=1352 RepID=UPI0009A0B68E|nr:S8 family peptidase [Enterococcus faecium]MDO7985181.1 S8 family peptidase [Enterococcus faecium]VFA62106.1 type VII secretion-associated serine protease mycosin [Enterococcus faecium]HAR1359226.1 S8 family peptidase [Enterococcus faecium]